MVELKKKAFAPETWPSKQMYCKLSAYNCSLLNKIKEIHQYGNKSVCHNFLYIADFFDPEFNT
jgi:hypothetical protein